MSDERESERLVKATIVPEPPPSLIPPADATLTLLAVAAPPPLSGPALAPPRQPLSRSLPPLPAVEPILDVAHDARLKKDWDAALEAYKKALFVLPKTDADAHASIYASIAEVKLAQDKPREAETNFEKALGAKPKHRRSLDGLITLATDAKEWDRVATFRKKRAEAFDDDPEERVAELCRLADMYETEKKDLKKAAATLEGAVLGTESDVGIFLKLKDLYTTLRVWPKVLDTFDALVKVATDPKHRAAHRFGQAEIHLGRLRDEPRAIAFLELALDEDPQCDRALSALVAVRTRREEWAELAAVYERLVDRHAGLGDRDRAWEVCRKLGTLRRDRLLDGPGALEAFQGALEVRPDDVESRAALAELYANKGDRTRAVQELERVAGYAPLRAQTYRRLFDLHQRAQRPDRAWLAATVLEELGASDVAQDLVIEQYRPDGPIRPTTAMDAGWWDELLAPIGADPIVASILKAVAETAIAIRLEELAAKKKLPFLDPVQRQDKSSTASVVRTFVWAARALGITLPDLYLLDEVPNGIAAAPAPSPATALGPQVRSGMTVQQLSFLAGRHLTYYREEFYPLVFFPTLADLSSLVLSAVRLVIPAISVPPPSDAESRVAESLGARLPNDRVDAIEAAVAKLDARGGKLDLMAWIRSVELTATRAGLLLAGDLRVASRAMKDEARTVGELTYEAKRSDLCAFVASDGYGQLRERMGVAIHASSGSGLHKAAKPAE